MNPLSADQQLAFLTNMQRLLAEGQFVATYKYALLLALADIAIELGDDTGDSLVVSTKLISDKFIQYYWRQCIPYLPPSRRITVGGILKQNTGSQAAIIRRIMEARTGFGDSLAAARRDTQEWKRLVREVDSVVRVMPLWKLQTVGDGILDFLYENLSTGTSIALRPGVSYCLRRFYDLIGDLVRGAWI